GSDFTIGFGRKHQLSLGAKFPFHRIGREKTNQYTENFGIANASYQYFFWEKPAGIRAFGVLNVEYSFWNYSRDFFYNEGEIVYETLNSSTSYDYSFNAENGIQSKGVNLYVGGGIELPISNKLYFSGFMAVGTGNYLQKRNFIDLDNSIQLIDNYPIRSRSFAFQASLSVGYRFN
ncbi:MAG: hypothetical protein AB8B56_09755, partial [Crocinitomicaceae bacterium]